MKYLSVIFLLVSVLLAATLTQSQDSEPVENESRYGLTSDTTRDLAVTQNDFVLTIQAENQDTREGEDTRDEIEIRTEVYDTDSSSTLGFIEIELDYNTNAGDSSPHIEIDLDFDEIIEYTESGANPGYQENEDERLQGYSREDFGGFGEVTVAGTENVRVFETNTTDGVVRIRLFVTQAGSTQGNTGSQTITANEVGLEFTIQNFAFEQPGASRLAFETRTFAGATSSRIEQDIANRELRWIIKDTGFAMRFNWMGTAQFDGSSVDVITTEDPDNPESDILGRDYFYSFDTTTNATEIVWNTVLGLQGRSAASTKSVIMLLIVSLIATVVTLF
jgi:hypothetical protein